MSRIKTRATILLTLILCGWLVQRFMFSPSEAQAHERAWRDVRNVIRNGVIYDYPQDAWDYLRPKTWRWYFEGKPDRQSIWPQFFKHERELIRQGVLVSETVALTNRTYHEAMTNKTLFLLGPRGLLNDNCSQIGRSGAEQENVLIVGKPAWVRKLAAEIRKWDSQEQAGNK